MSDEMRALTEERKQEIIEKQPDGLWIVLDEEYPRDHTTPGDLLCGESYGGETRSEGV